MSDAANVDRFNLYIRDGGGFHTKSINGNWVLFTAYDALAKQRDELAAEVERLREALRLLELANDAVAGGRTHAVYLAMIDSGQSDALRQLDEARSNAYASLRRDGEG